MNYLLSEKSAAFLRSLQNPRGYSGETEPTRRIVTVHGEEDDFPPPFTVRWAQSENSGSGAWVIWLPDPARLLFYDEEWRTIGQITAAQTMPAGWFTMNSIRDQDRTVYLSVRDTRREGSTGGLVEASISRTDSQGGSGGDYFYCGKVAVMEVDSDTGARRVKQLINSAVEIAKNGNGGDEVALDKLSVNKNYDDEVQIKGWDDGAPVSSTTIAQDINNPPSNPSALVERDYNGELKYKRLGTLAELTGSSAHYTGKRILTGLSWNQSTHKLEISSANIDITNGVITSWVDQEMEEIETTDITSIISQTQGG